MATRRLPVSRKASADNKHPLLRHHRPDPARRSGNNRPRLYATVSIRAVSAPHGRF